MRERMEKTVGSRNQLENGQKNNARGRNHLSSERKHGTGYINKAIGAAVIYNEKAAKQCKGKEWAKHFQGTQRA